MSKRYLVAIDQAFEGGRYSFVYDTKYKSFVDVQRLVSTNPNKFEEVLKFPENFAQFFPGNAIGLVESDKLP